MGTYRFYRPLGVIPTRWWWFRWYIITGTAFYLAHQLDKMEEKEDIGSMHDKTFLYFNKYKNQEKYPNKLTFPREP